MLRSSRAQVLWDVFCACSLLGIWPRFIEPRLLQLSRIDLPLKGASASIAPLRVVHFSDLHLNSLVPNSFLDKLHDRIQALKPHLIAFSGDFLCFSQLNDPQRLGDFLRRFEAPLGCFAVLGNHDYERYLTLNSKGEYDVMSSEAKSLLRMKLRKLLTVPRLAGRCTDAASQTPPHQALRQLLAATPFQLLHNETRQVEWQGVPLNITGLGDYWAGQCLPEKAFEHYLSGKPGLILAHNPDSVEALKGYPGELMLSGHTHGGQVNLPLLRRRFLTQENPQLIRGIHHLHGKTLYINRGVGSSQPFRWRSRPEILLATLRGDLDS